jgi:hypothetical protein
VALASADAGKPNDATSAAMQALDALNGTESSAFAYMAMALAEVGKIAEANATINQIGMSKYISRPSAALAAALARTGKVPEAVRADPEDEDPRFYTGSGHCELSPNTLGPRNSQRTRRFWARTLPIKFLDLRGRVLLRR